MTRSLLSPAELSLWQAFKLAHDRVTGEIEAELQRSAKLSGADFGVLVQLSDSGSGKLRQQRLADSMHWEKSRLSHQLSRMGARGLIERKRDSAKSVTVQLTRHGRAVLAAARSAHAAAVRAHLLAVIPPRDRAALTRVYARLASATAGGG